MSEDKNLQRKPPLKFNRKAIQGCFPIADRHRPFLRDIVNRQVNDPDNSKSCLDEEGVPILFDVEIRKVDLFKTVRKLADDISLEGDCLGP